MMREEPIHKYLVQNCSNNITMKLKVGDEIIIDDYNKQEVIIDDEKYYAIKESAVIAVISHDE